MLPRQLFGIFLKSRRQQVPRERQAVPAPEEHATAANRPWSAAGLNEDMALTSDVNPALSSISETAAVSQEPRPAFHHGAVF